MSYVAADTINTAKTGTIKYYYYLNKNSAPYSKNKEQLRFPHFYIIFDASKFLHEFKQFILEKKANIYFFLFYILSF